MKKIGVLGGSFDPVHIGHLLLAEQAIEEGNLDIVYFMPAHLQPFKLFGFSVTDNDRLEMLKLSVKDNDGLAISKIELESEDVSFTYLTLCKLKRLYKKDTAIYFILGSDAFLNIKSWHKSKELLSEFRFMVGVRPGDDISGLENFSNSLKTEYGTNIHIIKNRQVDISSSEIRDRVNSEKTIRYMVPLSVKYYIERNGLYSDKVKLIKRFIEENISDNTRKEHIYSTAQEAACLAEHWGADVHKAYLAGLYHDIYKDTSKKEANELIKKIGLSGRYINNLNLAHAKLAAHMIPSLFGETDEAVINAVSYHTTGRENMSMLEKVIYIADLIEAGRSYDSVDKLRVLAYTNIDSACMQGIINTVEYLNNKGIEIDNDSLLALEYFKKIIKGDKDD